jgi:Leucine-rich repeat (LRR) protein
MTLFKHNNMILVKIILDHKDSLITSLNNNFNQFMSQFNVKQININNNNIKFINKLPFDLPHNLEVFNCSNNQLTELPRLPPTLKILNCENNKLQYLPKLPESLLELYCSYNCIYSMHHYILPSNLKVLKCLDIYMFDLPECPPSLTKIYCFLHNCWNENYHEL